MEEVILQTSDGGELFGKWVSGVEVPAGSDVHELAEYFGCRLQWLETGDGEPYKGGGAKYEHRETDTHDTASERDSRGVSSPHPALLDMQLWIEEQKDGLNYWEIAKAKLALEVPAFHEWLKMRYDK